ncbi:hypothetical protein [Paenibacillus periandrae]|uniref:hypothetical protein n=1 Tax=Paenibacillus periandrae TaxID=1761741 RepID=UPI001F08A585|nr:hypothetical protein [Paenibacillus periandrae]
MSRKLARDEISFLGSNDKYQLDHTQVDRHILKSGSVTVQPEMLDFSVKIIMHA